MIHKLFVYGTLAPNQPNEYVLKNLAGSWQEATVIGFYHKKGWGLTGGYPAIIIDEKAEVINGLLFSSDNLASHWHEIDEFEGESYKRIIVKVSLKDNTTQKAFTYVLNN